ncbi:MAG: hypothetical protein ACR2IS_16935 [Nitrososphaeraceae archaeon]
MRIPFKTDDFFAKEVNSAFKNIQNTYLNVAKLHIETEEVAVMLGDGSVSQSTTFELQKMIMLYERLVDSLEGWVSSGISKSNTEDLHRVYFQISQQVEKYYIYGYFGIQFHALPYYRVDKRVIEIQKELSHIAEEAAKIFSSLADKGNHVVQQELQKIGYSELAFEELFTKLFEDPGLIHGLERKVQSLEEEFPEFEQMRIKKNRMFAELNNLLVELYQISPVLMDYNGLMQGEEGVVTYFDIETIKNQKTARRDPYINTERVSGDLTNRIANSLNEVANVLKKTAIK